MKNTTYKNTEIGKIPDDWEVKELGKVCTDIKGGGTPSRSNEKYWNGKIPWMTVKDFNTFSPFSTQEYITVDGLKNSATRIVKAGNVILATRIALGEAVTYNIDVAINQDLKTIVLKEIADEKYFLYTYRSLKDTIIDKGSGSTVLGLSLNDLKSIKIPLPPLPEQRAIAKTLSDTDAWIESMEKLIAKKQAIKQGAMQELLKPKRHAESAEAWEVKKFNDVFQRIPTKKYQINSEEYCDSGKYKVIDQGKTKFIAYSSRADKVFTPSFNGVIIFGDHTRIIKYSNEKFIIGADGIQLINSLDNNNLYLFYFLKNLEIPNTGYNRHFKYLFDFDYYIPSFQEQTRIATILSDMDAEIEILEEKLVKARQIKEGMMQELLTGKIRLV